MPGWCTEACPYPSPDRSHLGWEWQQLYLRCHRVYAWSQSYPSSWPVPFVGEEWQKLQVGIEWGRPAGVWGRRIGHRELVPGRPIPGRWDCAGARGSEPLVQAPLSHWTSLKNINSNKKWLKISRWHWLHTQEASPTLEFRFLILFPQLWWPYLLWKAVTSLCWVRGIASYQYFPLQALFTWIAVQEMNF